MKKYRVGIIGATGMVGQRFATILEIPYADIESVQLCNVGGLVQIIPTGIKVTLKSGKSYKLSVTKRKEILAFIQEKI